MHFIIHVYYHGVGGVINRLALPHNIVIVIVPFVTFVVCYALYYLLKKALPQVLAVLCGGRI